MALPFFEKGIRFPENLSQSIENVQNFHWLSHKNMPEGYFENPSHGFLEEPMFFLLYLTWNL